MHVAPDGLGAVHSSNGGHSWHWILAEALPQIGVEPTLPTLQQDKRGLEKANEDISPRSFLEASMASPSPTTFMHFVHTREKSKRGFLNSLNNPIRPSAGAIRSQQNCRARFQKLFSACSTELIHKSGVH